MIVGSFRIHSLVISDYELSKTSAKFNKTLKTQPKNHEALFGLGKNYFYLLDYQSAVDSFTKALTIKPNEGNYMVWLGASYLF